MPSPPAPGLPARTSARSMPERPVAEAPAVTGVLGVQDVHLHGRGHRGRRGAFRISRPSGRPVAGDPARTAGEGGQPDPGTRPAHHVFRAQPGTDRATTGTQPPTRGVVGGGLPGHRAAQPSRHRLRLQQSGKLDPGTPRRPTHRTHRRRPGGPARPRSPGDHRILLAA